MHDVKIKVSRRTALVGAGAAVASTITSGLVSPTFVQASEPSPAPNPSLAAEHAVGEFKVFTLLDGAVNASDPQSTFGMNQEPEVFAEVSRENFIPHETFRAFFTPTVVDTGQEIVLFDTGVGEGGRPARGNMRAALAGAGFTPEQVDVVVLTHMHPDHIGGLMEGGAPAFPNARYVTGQTEYDFWAGMDPESNGVAKLVADNVTPLADRMTFVGEGDSVVSGITAMSAFGHTPGHMLFMLESGGQPLLLAADTANHYVWSLAYPDWQVRFDMDKTAAAETRRRIFGMLAADRVPFVGYHMPFPAVGYVEARDNGFRYVPASYQLQL